MEVKTSIHVATKNNSLKAIKSTEEHTRNIFNSMQNIKLRRQSAKNLITPLVEKKVSDHKI